MICQLDARGEETRVNWKWVWQTPAHRRVQHFLWLCMHNAVPTTSLLLNRGMSVDSLCKVCEREEEDLEHVLRNCPIVVDIWRSIQVPQSKQASFRVGVHEWLKVNAQACEQHVSLNPWSSIFLYTIWVQADKGRKGEVFISRMPPKYPWMKLNSDGAVDQAQGRASSRSIIRDLVGKWVGGGIRYIGQASSLVAELWGLRDGLCLTKYLGIKFLSVELDALIVVNCIN